MDCRMLSTESEKFELRRCLRGFVISTMVEARPDRRVGMGEWLCRAVLLDMGEEWLEGLKFRSGSILWSGRAMGEMVLWMIAKVAAI